MRKQANFHGDTGDVLTALPAAGHQVEMGSQDEHSRGVRKKHPGLLLKDLADDAAESVGARLPEFSEVPGSTRTKELRGMAAPGFSDYKRADYQVVLNYINQLADVPVETRRPGEGYYCEDTQLAIHFASAFFREFYNSPEDTASYANFLNQRSVLKAETAIKRQKRRKSSVKEMDSSVPLAVSANSMVDDLDGDLPSSARLGQSPFFRKQEAFPTIMFTLVRLFEGDREFQDYCFVSVSGLDYYSPAELRSYGVNRNVQLIANYWNQLFHSVARISEKTKLHFILLGNKADDYYHLIQEVTQVLHEEAETPELPNSEKARDCAERRTTVMLSKLLSHMSAEVLSQQSFVFRPESFNGSAELIEPCYSCENQRVAVAHLLRAAKASGLYALHHSQEGLLPLARSLGDVLQAQLTDDDMRQADGQMLRLYALSVKAATSLSSPSGVVPRVTLSPLQPQLWPVYFREKADQLRQSTLAATPNQQSSSPSFARQKRGVAPVSMACSLENAGDDFSGRSFADKGSVLFSLSSERARVLDAHDEYAPDNTGMLGSQGNGNDLMTNDEEFCLGF